MFDNKDQVGIDLAALSTANAGDLREQNLTAAERFTAMGIRIEDAAFFDSLTGIHNRFAAMLLANAVYADAFRNSKPVVVIIVDLDYFKQVNDQFGHLAGNDVLRVTAQRLNAIVRPLDVCARFGGDEFLCVLQTDEAGGLQFICRMRGTLAERSICTSIGMVAWDPTSGTPAPGLDELIRLADVAMYADKARAERTAADPEAAALAVYDALRLHGELSCNPIEMEFGRPAEPAGYVSLAVRGNPFTNVR